MRQVIVADESLMRSPAGCPNQLWSIAETLQQCDESFNIAAVDLPAALIFGNHAGRSGVGRSDKQDRPAGGHHTISLARYHTPCCLALLSYQSDISLVQLFSEIVAG